MANQNTTRLRKAEQQRAGASRRGDETQASAHQGSVDRQKRARGLMLAFHNGLPHGVDRSSAGNEFRRDFQPLSCTNLPNR